MCERTVWNVKWGEKMVNLMVYLCYAEKGVKVDWGKLEIWGKRMIVRPINVNLNSE